MIALLLLLGLLSYIGLAVLLTFLIRRRFTTSRAKSIATIVSLLAFILIPTADEFAGKWYFDSLCKNEAGTKIYKSIEDIEGMFTGGFPFSELEKLGYKFREYEFLGKYYRESRAKNGKGIKEEIPQPTTRYLVKGGGWQEVRLGVRMDEQQIVDTQTGETLARYTNFSYGGGWVSDMLRSWGLSGGLSCQLTPDTYKEFYANTLKPPKSRSNNS